MVKYIQNLSIHEAYKEARLVELFKNSTNPLVQAVLNRQTTFISSFKSLVGFYEKAEKWWNPLAMMTLISYEFIEEAEKINRAFSDTVELEDQVCGGLYSLTSQLSLNRLSTYVLSRYLNNTLLLTVLGIVALIFGYATFDYLFIFSFIISGIGVLFLAFFIIFIYLYIRIIKIRKTELNRVMSELENLDQVASEVVNLIHHKA